MKLIYLKYSLEISREMLNSDEFAMWNVFGVPGIAEGSTRTLETIKQIKQDGK